MTMFLLVLLLSGAILGYGITPLIRLVKMLQNEGEGAFNDGESSDETYFDVAD
jgi:hypothetical protein